MPQPILSTDSETLAIQKQRYHALIVENRVETPILSPATLAPPTTRGNNTRPSVPPVYGTCGHIARSPYHTCGSWACEGGF